MTENARTLADLGESGLLAQVFPLLTSSVDVLVGPGDDAAVVAAPDGRFVVTTDVLVQDVDFRLDWSTGFDVGWKAAMQNLADVASMGARPTAVVIGLVAPGDTPADWALELTRGLAAGCSRFGAAVVGGDLSSGDAIVVSITAFGDLGGRSPVLRSGARPGDVVAVAGESGWSAAGLALLASGVTTAPPGPAAYALDRHRRPHPPVNVGIVASDAGATAMIDTSDGLLRDLGRVARASGVTIQLDPSALDAAGEPLRPVAELLGGDPLDWVLSGGEDHALAACFPADATVPDGFWVVGQVVPRAVADVLGGEGHSLGYDHFRVD